MFLTNSTKCLNTETAVAYGEHTLGTKPIECPTCLGYINEARLLHEVFHNADGTIDKDLNIKRMGDQARKFVHEKTLEEHFVYMKGLETLTACVHFLYSQRLVRERINDPAAKKEEFEASVAKEKFARRPEKEKKQLNSRDKAIKVLMDSMPGMITLEQATAAIDQQYKAQGKVTS